MSVNIAATQDDLRLPPKPERRYVFRGKFLEDMTKEELIECAKYSAKRIEELQKRSEEYLQNMF
jgi:hypothetical protein